ncbi:MAG TPA: hypothetical protein DIT97_19450, partial [Gimesia maris]|nr:hypothetical protein [Gimesia maris]
ESKPRLIPGAEHYPQTADILKAEQDRLAEKYQLSQASIQTLWTLQGTMIEEILDSLPDFSTDLLPGTNIPRQYVLWTINHEWVETIGDLVERRLMLIFDETLQAATLQALAECLVETGKLEAAQIPATLEIYQAHLTKFYGKRIL